MKKLKPIQFKTEDFGPLIFRITDDVTHFYQYYGIMESMGDEHHHLYFGSTDEIKKGDHGIQFNDIGSNPVELFYWDSNVHVAPESVCYKIEATTDRKMHKKFGIPLIPESYVRHFAYKNGDIDFVEIEVGETYVEPVGIHSNRGHFIDVVKTNKDGEIVIYEEPVPMVDWNGFTMDQYAKHLEDHYIISSTGIAKCAIELVENYRETKKDLQWILNEYIANVNEEDAITNKLKKLIGDAESN